MKNKFLFLTALFILICSGTFAQNVAATIAAPKVDTGDTAWVMFSAALVLLMTIPGLAIFYGGLVRRKNVLSVLMQCFITTAVVSIEWVICGYSLSFSHSESILSPFIGGFDWAFLNGIGINDLSPYFISHSQLLADGTRTGTIPHLTFIMFQCMFAVITPALLIGAFTERINFKGFLMFTILWSIFVYNPVAHWTWSSDGWLFKMGILDFAGGTVVEINAGIAALVTAIMLGRRRDYKDHALPPHNIPLVVIGAALLWFGWFGFNAGSGLAADGLAGNAFLTTHLAAAIAALLWGTLEWIEGKKPTTVGVCTGAVAGMVAITPAAGFVNIAGALIIGTAATMICFVMVAFAKPKLRYDDSLDVFGIHGVAGIIGTILTGILATPTVQAAYSGAVYGNMNQLSVQLVGVLATIAFSAIGTALMFFITDKTVGMRAPDKQEAQGLDESQHGETAYTTFD